MSRLYHMEFVLAPPRLADASLKHLLTALQELWDIDEGFWDTDLEQQVVYRTQGTDCLAGGETEEEFAARVATHLWERLNAYVFLRVRATYLEDLPYALYTLDQTAYEQWCLSQSSAQALPLLE